MRPTRHFAPLTAIPHELLRRVLLSSDEKSRDTGPATRRAGVDADARRGAGEATWTIATRVSSLRSSNFGTPCCCCSGVSRRWNRVLRPQRPAWRMPRKRTWAARKRQRARVRRAKRDPYDPIVVLTLIGRLFLVLAGGFFLRAMTEAGVLPAPVGVGLAFVYAAGLARVRGPGRSGRDGLRRACSTRSRPRMVAFPLLVEATTRFKVLTVSRAARSAWLS